MAIMSPSVAGLIFKTRQLYQFGDVKLGAHRHVHKTKNNKRNWDEKEKKKTQHQHRSGYRKRQMVKTYKK